MIRAEMISRGEACCVRMDGHADFDPGHDIVCAAASAIVCTLVGYLHNCGAHLFKIHEQDVQPGHVVLRFRGDEIALEACRMAAIGLLQLEQQYPDHVRVTADLEGL